MIEDIAADAFVIQKKSNSVTNTLAEVLALIIVYIMKKDMLLIIGLTPKQRNFNKKPKHKTFPKAAYTGIINTVNIKKHEAYPV